MIWLLGIVCFLIVVGCYKSGKCSIWQVIIGLLVLPFFPIVLWGIIVYYCLKLIGEVLFKKWA